MNDKRNWYTPHNFRVPKIVSKMLKSFSEMTHDRLHRNIYFFGNLRITQIVYMAVIQYKPTFFKKGFQKVGKVLLYK